MVGKVSQMRLLKHLVQIMPFLRHIFKTRLSATCINCVCNKNYKMAPSILVVSISCFEEDSTLLIILPAIMA